MSLPVQTAVWLSRAEGALVVLVAAQLFVPWIIAPTASVQKAGEILSTPDDHFTASPDRGVKSPRIGRVGCASGRPTIDSWIVPPACVKASVEKIISAPDDHFTARPHRGMIGSLWAPGYSSNCLRSDLSAASVKLAWYVLSAPDDHFATGPDCAVLRAARRRIGSRYSCPDVRVRVVPSTGVRVVVTVITAPDDHFNAGPHGGVAGSWSRSIGEVGSCPSVCVGVVLSAVVCNKNAIKSAPDDHFHAGPHGGVVGSWSRSIGEVGSCPSVRVGVVSPTGVQIVRSKGNASPDDHLATGPDCAVLRAARGAPRAAVAVQLSDLGSYLPPVFTSG